MAAALCVVGGHHGLQVSHQLVKRVHHRDIEYTVHHGRHHEVHHLPQQASLHGHPPAPGRTSPSPTSPPILRHVHEPLLHLATQSAHFSHSSSSYETPRTPKSLFEQPTYINSNLYVPPSSPYISQKKSKKKTYKQNLDKHFYPNKSYKSPFSTRAFRPSPSLAYGPPQPKAYGPPPSKAYRPHPSKVYRSHPSKVNGSPPFKTYGPPLSKANRAPPPKTYGPSQHKSYEPSPYKASVPALSKSYGPPGSNAYEPTSSKSYKFTPSNSYEPSLSKSCEPLPSSSSIYSYDDEYPDEPPVYKFSYSVWDEHEGSVVSVGEARDEYNTHGSYQVYTTILY